MIIDLQTSLDIMRIRPEQEGFGKVLSFEIECSELYLICVFNNNQIGIYDTFKGTLAYQLEQPGFRCENAFIDEVGCFITMLDETKTKANIHVIEWKYEVEEPPERNNNMSTIESLDDQISEKGEKKLAEMKNKKPGLL